MNIDYGKGKTEYGPGVQIILSGDEIATAIDAYLVSQGVHVNGPRTIRVNGQLFDFGEVYVDPSGFVIFQGKKFSGRGASLKEQALEQLKTLEAYGALDCNVNYIKKALETLADNES